jgi:hypothetical protein
MVMLQDGSVVRIDCDGIPVSFEAARVRQIRRNFGQPTARKAGPRPPAASGARLAWEAAAVAGLGWGWGSLAGQGTLIDVPAGATSVLQSSFAADGSNPGSEAGLRLLALPADWSENVVLGVQMTAGGETGPGMASSRWVLEGLAGMRWPVAAALQVELLAGAGWSWERLERDLLVSGSVGTEAAESSANLSGPSLRAECGAHRSFGDWQAGVAVGAAMRFLDGHAEWSSARGSYRVDEDLAGEPGMTYLQVSIARRW